MTEVQSGFRSHRRFLVLWLVLRGVRELRKTEKKTPTWPSLMLARHMTVHGGRDSGVRRSIRFRGEVC